MSYIHHLSHQQIKNHFRQYKPFRRADLLVGLTGENQFSRLKHAADGSSARVNFGTITEQIGIHVD